MEMKWWIVLLIVALVVGGGIGYLIGSSSNEVVGMPPPEPQETYENRGPLTDFFCSFFHAWPCKK